MKICIISPALGLFLFMLVSPAHGADKSRKFQDRLEIYGYAVMTVDYLQTRDIISNEKYYEANPILGKTPTTRQVNSVFAAKLMLHSVFQDTKYRETWNWSVAIAHSVAVIHNKQLNVSVKF
jgi:hypothetical protein